MKKVIFAAALLFAGFSTAIAQDAVTPQQKTVTSDQDEKKMAPEELPAAVQTALRGDDYKGWKATHATKVVKEKKTVYKVEITNGTETKTVKLNDEGQKVA